MHRGHGLAGVQLGQVGRLGYDYKVALRYRDESQESDHVLNR